MSEEEFIEFLKKFCRIVNEKNHRKNKNDTYFIILDGRQFLYDEETNTYSVNEGFIEQAKRANILFVADNPGENEKIVMEYLVNPQQHQELNDSRAHLRAGCKLYNACLKIKDLKDDYIVFNKCLISTKETRGLTPKQVKYTQEEVISFIEKIISYNSGIIVVFLGTSYINKKSPFKDIMDHFKNKSNVYVTTHPVRCIFKAKGIECPFINDVKEISLKEFEKFLKEVKEKLWIAVDDNGNNPPQDEDNGSNGGDGGDDDGLASCCVRR